MFLEYDNNVRIHSDAAKKFEDFFNKCVLGDPEKRCLVVKFGTNKSGKYNLMYFFGNKREDVNYTLVNGISVDLTTLKDIDIFVRKHSKTRNELLYFMLHSSTRIYPLSRSKRGDN